MIKPLQIGNLVFTNNLIQGPLAGISCAPFRALTWRYGELAYCYTEMIASNTLIYCSKKLQHRFTAKAPHEGSVCFQLAASSPEEAGLATKIACDAGADLIDLNCGCPVKKIRKKGAGSSLLNNPSELEKILVTIKNNSSVPVTVKIRVDGASHERNNTVVAAAIKNSGIDALIVHGRHWTEHYETRPHLDQIKYFIDELTIPVIANGDACDRQSVSQLLALGAAGVMIARAGVGQPWLIAQLTAELQNKPYTPPSLAERAELYLDHIEGLITLMANERIALLQARQLARYYTRDLTERQSFCDAVNHCDSFAELKRLTYAVFRVDKK